MFLQPKRSKFKKIQKGKLKNLELKKNKLRFGQIGLKTKESGIISAKQLEAARQAIVRKTKRKGKLWIRIFPDLPISAKPIETRMGKGKGSVKYWAVRIKSGTVLFELSGISMKNARMAFNTGGAKISVKTKIFT
uniref:ribosomal protein L16 n=1 Tax=Odontella aurita TaxID=265563 RepID=UPI00202953CC|nr:ribosomal protein L16 [Odontella aurita]QYB22958.1 ribosomal protein L16 [Odontella aurita]